MCYKEQKHRKYTSFYMMYCVHSTARDAMVGVGNGRGGLAVRRCARSCSIAIRQQRDEALSSDHEDAASVAHGCES